MLFTLLTINHLVISCKAIDKFINVHPYYSEEVPLEKLHNDMCEQGRLRSDCASAQSDQCLLWSRQQSTQPADSGVSILILGLKFLCFRLSQSFYFSRFGSKSSLRYPRMLGFVSFNSVIDFAILFKYASGNSYSPGAQR